MLGFHIYLLIGNFGEVETQWDPRTKCQDAHWKCIWPQTQTGSPLGGSLAAGASYLCLCAVESTLDVITWQLNTPVAVLSEPQPRGPGCFLYVSV